MLRRAGRENFPVAPAFLPRAARRDLMAIYGFARLVDDIGDGDLPADGPDATALLAAASPPVRERARRAAAEGRPADARLAALDALEEDLLRAVAGQAAAHPLLAALTPTATRHRLDPEPFRRLVEANRRDQRVHHYDSYEQLVDYCAYSADPVGRLVLAVTGADSPANRRLSDSICTGLQIIEHLQDVAEDRDRGRRYLPAEDLTRFGVTDEDLRAPSAGPRLRALIAFEGRRAADLLDRGAPLVACVSGRLRVLLAGFVGGGRAALAAVAARDHDVLTGSPTPTPGRVLRETARVYIRPRARRDGLPTARREKKR
ncbi:squalene synthase HpnC [Allostreptomyces psammosilenae]|uniref:squalene synthase HpnC n=1 Tax=Allostreptomyces psammosilenae TaxID=1892865 RepID=UPI0028AF955D|nr:squalene synthase HpnC [Allostreptomyces psammosilenae]